MIKAASSLQTYRAKDLAQMAKRRGVSGWHSMRKEQLIKALAKLEMSTGVAPKRSPKASEPSRVGKNGSGSRMSVSEKLPASAPNRRIVRAHREAEERKDISSAAPRGSSAEGVDRVVLMVRDAYWLHAYWEISSRAIARVRAAMAEQWHSARPALRVLKAAAQRTNMAAEVVDRDIEIHGGVNNWYIDVNDPPATFRVEIGYLAANGKFFGVARSNSVTTPKSNSADLADQNWAHMARDCNKILAQSGAFSEEGNDGELQRLFEERFRRPMGSPMMTRFGMGAESILCRERDFSFEVDAEMIVFGSAQPDSHIMLGGEPVKVRSDGTFTLRLSMNEGRQVLPVVASSSDGMKQQTIILAVERNTKTMEPVARENATQ